jgi:DNA-binding response OmpR family regulator
MRNGDGKPAVLIVENDPQLHSEINALLEFHGYRPVPVTTGMEALARLGEENLDAVVVDPDLPDMSGLALANLIRTQYGDDVSILVVSPRLHEYAWDELTTAGADDFVDVARHPQRLVDCLETLLANG